MRALLPLILAMVFVLPATTGCGPDLSADDLGETVFQIPKIPEAEAPFDLPECKAPPPKEGPFATPP
jgi:hypothetical protein